MAAFHERVKNLPAEIAVFPLPGALLLPLGKLPLNIFEPRYLAMTEDVLGEGRMFGMIQPDDAQPDGATGPALYRIGCLGRLTSFSETDDGRFLITLHGVARFVIAGELEMRRGYRRVRADFSAFGADLQPPDAALAGRDGIQTALRDYFTRTGIDANWDAIRRLPDDMLVVTLAMLCPFAPVEKQALLEAVTEAERVTTLLALLRMGSGEPDLAGTRRTLS
ncbi:MAG: peptidase S16 [Acetobacteraceae bacterium]|nr:peptidase S16 [Acetobacteraceae bacterium]